MVSAGTRPTTTRSTGTFERRAFGKGPTSTEPSARATAHATDVRMSTPSASAWPPTRGASFGRDTEADAAEDIAIASSVGAPRPGMSHPADSCLPRSA